MAEIFTAELTVTERDPSHEQQLAQLAIDWFGGPVRRMSLVVSRVQVDGLIRYLMRGEFCAVGGAVEAESGSRLQAAARWLGLISPSSPT